ncbi:DUF3626 domain-containing protein [Amycolatopsis sp. A133]|uniref:DUF3626 domain-containing protein n=1 Tax=Amycolatopsis sp. A133 TaxID=3064472 RepID=UPI0027FFFFFD|nr:DUF3626 domain-containing protein [Amycolatopsis sp. A133]MDQ7810578.1 DUF3626 domain-containing protein [Amycolatopsis sp. A133]
MAWENGQRAPDGAWKRAVTYVAARATGPPLPADLDVTVHFHPDRPVGSVPLLRHWATDGVYRSQFETGTGNGGLTAHPGGARWRWEHRMFGGVYDTLPAGARPKYGSLNHRRRPAGGSVRFGSSHLRLKPDVLERVTFCYPDSFREPADFGTAAHLPLIPLVEADAPDELDDYIEAHVHGPLRLSSDVAALVLDPSFRGTDVETAAAGLPFPTEWHHGFRLSVAVLAEHADYRGEDVVRAGEAVAEDGGLDARIIGDAVRAGRHDPQVLKRLWHCTARFGLRG